MNKYPEFFVASTTERVEIPYTDHKGKPVEAWIDLKSEMSMGDWEAYESSLLQAEAEAGVSKNMNRAERRAAARQGKLEESTTLKISTGDIKLLEINIVAWSFKDVDVTRKSIAMLREPVCRQLLEKISELNPTNPLEQTTSATPTPIT